MNEFELGDVVYYKGAYPAGKNRYRYVVSTKPFRISNGNIDNMEMIWPGRYELVARGEPNYIKLTKVLNKLL